MERGMFRRELANAIRILSVDAIQKSNSGHPGAPMGMADIAEVLWNDFLKHNPKDPNWYDRDRFVLSNGHASMLLYSLLHLSGYNLSIEELKNFRQLHSKTPGHPEVGCTPGIEITTGPLGQGLANAIGLAIAERVLSLQFNKPYYEIVNHHTYVFMGDGCLMEGISHEVCSLAGALGLGKLIGFYDCNGISIDGETEGWFTDNTERRFKSYHWHVIREIDGHNPREIKKAIKEAKSVKDKPSLIICRTTIGFGSPNKGGKKEIHGAALGEDEVALVRKKLNWKYPPFKIPKKIYAAWNACERGKKAQEEWIKKISAYKKAYPNMEMEFMRRMKGDLPKNWKKKMQELIVNFQKNLKKTGIYESFQNILNYVIPILPEIYDESSLTLFCNAIFSEQNFFKKKNIVRNHMRYGVREFGKAAITNGVARHGGFIPCTSTFLMFSEYSRNAMRMAALMKTRQILIYTYNSVSSGISGLTYREMECSAIEAITGLRLVPNFNVWRPCDQIEFAVGWKLAIERYDGPSALILSEKKLLQVKRTAEQIKLISRGGYILKESVGKPEIILITTGSEVEITMIAAEKLTTKGISVRVVSMPSTNIFDIQDEVYRESVLPSDVTARIAVEAGIANFWCKYVGLKGIVIGVNKHDRIALFDKFSITRIFTVENIIKKAQKIL